MRIVSFWKCRGCLLAVGLAAAAIACTAKAQTVNPSPQVVSEMNRGVSLMGQYQYSEAAKAFEQVVKQAPNLLEARINLAIALFNRNGQEDLAAAEKVLKEVLVKEPGNIRALYFQAIVLQHVGKAEEAIPNLQAVLKQRPSDGATWYLLALCKQRVGQPAEQEFLKAIEFRPYLFSAYYQLYQASMRAGRQAQAMQYVERFKTLRESPLGESLEFPQYNQMGDLALALPVPASRVPPVSTSKYQLGAGKVAFTWSGDASPEASDGGWLSGAAVGDLNQDGAPDVLVALGSTGRLVFLKGGNGAFTDATPNSGLEQVSNALSCAIGDFDNDEQPDLCVITSSGSRLFRNTGEGKFADVTSSTGVGDGSTSSRSGLFLDADHDGDLDVFVCDRTANQLWNNNGNGSFTNIAAKAGVACLDAGSIQVLPGDIDDDRDMDLVILRQGGPARVFLNELLGQYRELDGVSAEMRGDAGGVLQDFNGDGLLDLVLLGGDPARLQLWVGNGQGKFQPSAALAEASQTLQSWGPLTGFRVADIDLDGDLDIACAATQLHFLLNDGQGRFVLQAQVWKPEAGRALAGFEMLDLNGDFVPDLVLLWRGESNRIEVVPGELTPPSTALAVQPTGVRGRDGRTRSPASGYGVEAKIRAGLREQLAVYTGQSGGLNQSSLPWVAGLGGAAKADYIQIAWPDGVAQVEIALAAGQTHKIAELQRKISSCPVLFAWNGTRFAFITDFAGVGGLGYYQAPGEAAPPQVLEHVKLEPDQLAPRNGFYELRVTEPMEESAYVDRLELLAIDHPAGTSVYPDERLAITGPAPTHELLYFTERVLPLEARDPKGRDCMANLARVDRVYAYEPVLDRRYVGFCEPHTLELDFGDRLRAFDVASRVFLFIKGYIEYPYSQTVYAASQSKVGWEPIRIDAQDASGQWRTIEPDAGVPGGMDRMMAVDLSGKVRAGTRKLRLTTNLEVFYDQVFLARTTNAESLTVQSVPLKQATLRYLGFPREFSPDGRLPLLYDYDLCDATAPFHRLKGAYTRYGPVEELLTDFDDRYVLVGPGDEIALKFDSAALRSTPSSYVRSFVLVSHAYCKDMDLYTATPQTLAPLPFRGMSRYPYPASEQYPATDAHRVFQQTYNTRILD